MCKHILNAQVIKKRNKKPRKLIYNHRSLFVRLAVKNGLIAQNVMLLYPIIN